MAVRTYPSQQDTNLTAKGSLLISIDAAIDYVEIYINNNIWTKKYPIVNGLYSIPINIGDVIKIDASQEYSMTLGRYDYTTDDNNGDNGIKNTAVSFNFGSNSYSFTATTLSSSYNFEYRVNAETTTTGANLLTEDSKAILAEDNKEIIIQQNI